jgi:hypothetical protein
VPPPYALIAFPDSAHGNRRRVSMTFIANDDVPCKLCALKHTLIPEHY